MRALVTARPLAVFDSPERVRKNFFSAYTPEDVVVDTFQRLQDDSPRAIVADMALLDLVRTKAITTPLLVIGADHDAVHPPRQIHDTARAYATTAHIIARAGHDLMLETAWPIAAHTILDWLSERSL